MPLVSKTFSQIITFTRASTATYLDSAGVLQSAAVDTPRLDYNPSTLAAQGLLIEEARTNSIRNNTMQGAVAGTPGTAPTNWTRSASPTSGISSEIVGTSTETGISYIDIRFTGTATATFSFNTNFETTTQVAASPSQTWAVSTYVKLTAGVLNGANISFTVGEYSSVPAFLRNNFSSVTTPTSAGLATQRASYSFTTGASTASIQPQISANFTNGLTYDFTLRIGLPQLELGAFATSVIPTTTTALTRSADVASVNTLSPWFNSAAGTLYTEFLVPQIGRSGRLFAVDDGSITNMIDGTIGAANAVAIESVAAGVYGGFAGTANTITANTTQKSAFTFSTSASETACLNAGTVGTNNITLPSASLTRLLLGQQGNSASTLCGYLRRLTFYPRQLSNAELQSITA